MIQPHVRVHAGELRYDRRHRYLPYAPFTFENLHGNEVTCLGVLLGYGLAAYMTWGLQTEIYRIPLVVSLGALDMVNFGAIDTVPEKFRQRNLHVHNAQVTLMRTNPEENRQCARWIANKLNRSVAPLDLLIPEQGVSMLDAPGQPFHDPEADEALFSELERAIDQTDSRRVIRLPMHINDPRFSDSLAEHFDKLMAATDHG